MKRSISILILIFCSVAICRAQKKDSLKIVDLYNEAYINHNLMLKKIKLNSPLKFGKEVKIAKSIDFYSLDFEPILDSSKIKNRYYQIHLDSNQQVVTIEHIDNLNEDNNYHLQVIKQENYNMFVGVRFFFKKSNNQIINEYSRVKPIYGFIIANNISNNISTFIYERPFMKKKGNPISSLNSIYKCDETLYPLLKFGIKNNFLSYITQIYIEEELLKERLFLPNGQGVDIRNKTLPEIEILFTKNEFEELGIITPYFQNYINIPLWLWGKASYK